MKSGLHEGEDGLVRCWWCGQDPEYRRYHDEEWGRPVHDDVRLFEKICLEGFQSGLSWLTILRKRPAFRHHFAGFDFRQLAQWGETEVASLLQVPEIVRHRKKIESTLNNARQACRMVDSGEPLADFIWRFVPPPEERPAVLDFDHLSKLGQTPTSKRLSEALKKRGWTFVGPTTAYAFMQAVGIVNDHLAGCSFRRS